MSRPLKSSSVNLLLRDEILLPIPGENPSGSDLRYDNKLLIFDQIREARRQDDELDQGAWQTERKVANWPLVITLAQNALATVSKDLQLAAYLSEALLQTDGFAGLRQGLDLTCKLITQYWDTIYPANEDGDFELRAAPLNWFGLTLDFPIRSIAIVTAGYSEIAYQESRLVGYEDQMKTDKDRKNRNDRIKAGKLAPEDFDKAVAETPKSFYLQTEKDLDACLELVSNLETYCDEKFESDAPSFSKLKTALEDVRHVVHLLREKRREPEPVEAAPDPDEAMLLAIAADSPPSDRFSAARSSSATLFSVAIEKSVRLPAVDFTLTAPRSVEQGIPFEMFVWAHLPELRNRVLARAREELGTRHILTRTKGPIRIHYGTELTVRLRILGAIIQDSEDNIVWEGESTCASFVVTLPELSGQTKCYGSAHIYVEGISIAKIPFVLSATRRDDGIRSATAEHYQTAFASYASEDRDAVLGRIQGIRKVAPDLDIFLDVMSLRSGLNWEQELWRVIPASDIFYLFWSSFAKRSEWVEKEWRCALRERGIGFIDPIPLQPPEESPPPQELSSLHFNDPILPYRRQSAN
jgi:type VI secretion system ImpA family protein